jgi:Protein of unknown function (DUF2793)
MSDTPNLVLPYIAAAQAQKHVTHNEALSLLDGLLQLSVVSRGLNAPPGAAVDGNRFLIGTAPTAEWLNHAGHVAYRMEGAWRFLIPRKGWQMWVEAENLLLIFDGSNWNLQNAPTVLQNLSMLGVNATADATNKVSINSSALLFNNVGNGVQVKLNKNVAADTASLLYQTGFSGRAEMGATGDDGFHIKVSPDGTTWKEAFTIDAASGLATVFANPTSALGVATKQYVDANAGGGGSPGGTAGQVQFKNGTAFGGFTLGGDATLNTTTGALTLNAVGNAKLASMLAFSLKGNNTAAAATPIDLTAAQAKTLLAIAVADVAGLGSAATQNVAAFDPAGAAAAITPTSLGLGNVNNTSDASKPISAATATALAGKANTVHTHVAGDISGLGTLATQSGTFAGTHSGASSGTNTGDQTIALTGDVLGSGTGSFAATIAAGVVNNAKLSAMNPFTFKANATSIAASPQDLNIDQTLIALNAHAQIQARMLVMA